MHLRILSILCSLTWVLVSANEYIPIVKKKIVQGPQKSGFSEIFDLVRFGDSDTVIFNNRGHLDISFDNGDSWKAVNEIEEAYFIYIDPFHQERAFVTARSGKISEYHVTEDRGKSWRKLSIPLKEKDFCYIQIHPFDRNLLLLQCMVDFQHQQKSIMYGSDNGGKSFKRIVESFGVALCKFAASSKESTLKSDGMYCLVEASKDIRMQFSNGVEAGEEISSRNDYKLPRTFFYTVDFGKTKKIFDELDHYQVQQFFVLRSIVAVVTLDTNDFKSSDPWDRYRQVWIFRGKSFKQTHLPDEMSIWLVRNISEDDKGRLFLDCHLRNDSPYSPHLLVSDSSEFISWKPMREPVSDDENVKQVGNLKGTLWSSFSHRKTFNNTEKKVNRLQNSSTFKKKGNWLQKFINTLKNCFIEEPHVKVTPLFKWVSTTKGSFDNGETWINLKIVDPSGKHKHLFKCNINDVEHCSFQPSLFQPSSIKEEEPTAGVIIKNGVAGESPSGSRSDLMTFISRDGGLSWEVAFDFLVRSAVLDFGNIIVAMPIEDEKLTERFTFLTLYTKFFFSLDQGRTWAVYYLEEPIHADDIKLKVHDLKAYIGFANINGESVEYVSYSIDFSNAFNGIACTRDDWERWYVSNGTCIDGKKYSFERRKSNAKCLMKKTFERLELQEEVCV